MKRTLLIIAIILIAISTAWAQDRYNADIQYFDESQTAYYTQCPRTIAAGTYTLLGTSFDPLYPVSLLNGIYVYMYTSAGSPSGVKIEVYATDVNGLPTGLFPLASLTKAYSEITWNAWNYFDFSTLNLSFDAGEKFFVAYSIPNGVPGTTWAGPLLNLAATPAHSYRYFTTGTTGWQPYAGEWYFAANVEYDAPFYDVAASSIWFTGDIFLSPGTSVNYEADVENVGDQAVSNVPVTIEISTITYTREIVYTNTQIVPTIGIGEEVHVTGFPAFEYTNPGEYIVTLRTGLGTDMNNLNDSMTLEQQIVTFPTVLTYDDGTADGAWAPNTAGNYFANKFESPVGPLAVTSLQYYIWADTWPAPGTTTMGIAVFDDDGLDGDGNPGAPGTQLYYADVTCTRGAWNTYDISGSGVLVPDGSFFVAWKALDAYPNCPGMAVDNNAPWTAWKASWQSDGAVWYAQYPEYQMDWMMRAGVDYVEFWTPEDLTINYSGNDILLDWMDVPAANFYEIYHGTAPDAITNRIGTDVNVSNYTHINALSQERGFYKVTASTEEMARSNQIREIENQTARRRIGTSLPTAPVLQAE